MSTNETPQPVSPDHLKTFRVHCRVKGQAKIQAYDVVATDPQEAIKDVVVGVDGATVAATLVK